MNKKIHNAPQGVTRQELMKNSHGVLSGTLCLALVAVVYCVWTAFGNDVNVCVTEGCSLYQDANLGGVSLWWIGAVAFAVLALLALVGAARVGRVIAGLALTGDILLLLLMAATAPCISCLGAALFFAGVYACFRRADLDPQGKGVPARRSLLVLCWLVLFLINAGASARLAASVWSISDPSGAPTVRVFYSPSCAACAQAIEALSGNVGVAFYPVAETPEDVYMVAAMREAVESGRNMKEALELAKKAENPGGFAALSPDMLWLRLRLLRNKAHVYLSGSQTVPFIEYHGLPAMLAARPERAAGRRQDAGRQEEAPAQASPAQPSAASLPLEPVTGGLTPRGGADSGESYGNTSLFDDPVAGSCGGQTPCPQ